MNASGTHGAWRHEGGAGARGVGTAIVVVLHAALLYGLLQLSAVEVMVTDAQAVFVRLVASAPAVEPPKASVSAPSVTPQKKDHVQVTRHVAPPEAPSPPAAEEMQGETEASPQPPQRSDPASVAVALMHPTPTASASPKYIITVSYLRPPALEYPAVSRRMNEQGRVVVRVLIDREGRVLRAELEQASPYERLNVAALRAAREALYMPYLEDGEPRTVWALVPLVFELKG